MSARRAALCLAVVAALVGTGAAQAAITVTSYPFTSPAGVLDDMSTGTTQLVAANLDDTASSVVSIGFDFWYDGVRFNQFSVNANGVIRLGSTVISTAFDNSTGFNSTTNAPKIAPYFDDLWTGTNGKVHYKVTGSAPNRKLTIEWLNEQIPRVGSGNTGAGTFQAWLFETTGVIEFVYGSGVALNSANGGYSIGLQSGAATNFASVTSTGPTVSYAAANNTQTNAIASGTGYVFTPVVPSAPTGLNFTGTTAISTTLNWTDNSGNEVGFAIYKSTDGGTTYNFLTQTAANATSQADNSLAPSTNYFYQVYAVTEGALGGPATNNVTTPAAGNISSTGAGGPWSVPATWAGGVVPGAADNVTIVDGSTVTIDTAALAYTVTVGQGTSGVLQFDSAGAQSLTVGDDVTIANNGTLQSATSGTVTTHALNIGGDLTNNGTLDMSTNANTAGGVITFTGAPNNTFGGTGGTTDIRQITMNKGSSAASILELTTSNFTVQGVTTDVAGWLASGNGTFKLSGAFAGTNRVFTAAAYTITAAGGFWLNNPNYTVAGQNGSPTQSGLLRISQGTFNIGTASGNSMGFGGASTTIVEGGAVNAAGRFGVSGSTNVISYTQTGGTVTVCTVGNASTTLASFDLGTSTASTVSITGGTIVVQLANTGGSGPRDYRHQASTGFSSATGGTLQLGNAASGAAKTFTMRGILPGTMVVTNTSAGHTGQMDTTLVNYNNLSHNITINSGATFNANNVVFLFDGQTLTNNGTLTHNGASSNFVFFDDGSTGAQTYTGTGVVTAPLTNLALQNSVTFTSTNQVPATAIRLFAGSVTNANKLTLGNGGATTGTLQIGNTTTPTAAGTFDVPLTFNLGTGGQVTSYLRTTASRSTGPEINPGRALTTMTYDDNDATHTLTVTGGNLDVNTTLNLTNGRIITSTGNDLHVGGAGSTVRTAGHVDGPFRKTYTAAGSKTFEVGTANGFSPVAMNNVASAGFPLDITVTAVQSEAPNIVGTVITRYWTLNAPGVTSADVVFTYLDPTDLTTHSVNEANMVAWRHDGPGPTGYTNQGGTINTGANTCTVTGVTQFSDWTLAEPTPTPVELIDFSIE